MMEDWSETISYQLWEVLPEVWMEDDPSWIGPTKWAELSFVCVTASIESSQEMFTDGLHLFFILADST